MNLTSTKGTRWQTGPPSSGYPHLNLFIKIMNLQLENNRSSSPEQDREEPSIHLREESFDFRVSKHLIPPPLMLLPKPVNHKPRSLTPMLPLPAFVGIIPNFQPLDRPITMSLLEKNYEFSWIGEAFDNVIYRKYQEQSYKRIDNIDQNWNIWACDINQMGSRKSAEDGVPDTPITPYYTPKNHSDKTLVFESRFECGNLSLVSKVSENEYNLLLQNDINTNGYSQWFFFKVSNTFKNHRVRFNILNQYKMNNLYKMGMKVIIYSRRQSEEKNFSWHRGGENIQYYQNGYSKSSTDYKPYFTLSWDYNFVYDNDEVYFAYSYPYTYSNLENFCFKIESDAHLRSICQRSTLCKTLAGNHVDILTITENHPFREIDKSYIIITARIHPGESVSSYVCNGIIEFLLSSNEKARKLRQNFIFKIIPMLNPDGVIHGNYRSNISGYDLNKKWDNPSKIYHPEIFYLKKLIVGLEEMADVALFCDLHGHSMKKNAFVYGCHDSTDPKKGKQFPLLMSKIFKGFSFKDCSFLDLEQTQGTSRTFLTKQLKHCDIYALESSFCGPEYENIHFTVRHFQELGEKFCEALLIYFNKKIKEKHFEAVMKSNRSHVPNQDRSYDSLPEYKEYKYIEDMDMEIFEDRVNSENSQLSQREDEELTVLEDKVIKKYLMLRHMRPGTSSPKRNSVIIRKKSHSKELPKMRLGDFLSSKSNSPVKRRELYQAPVKVQKPKITFKFSNEKKEIQPKLFEATDIIHIGEEKKKRYQSMGKITYEAERVVKSPQKHSIKVVLNKNFEFKQKQEEPIFRNTFLKSLAKEQMKGERKMSEFLIRKKVLYSDDKNSANLFNSVLSSLRKEKK